MSERRDPDIERACDCDAANAPLRFCPEFERFIAEAGIGIAEALGLIPPRVWVIYVRAEEGGILGL